jgi:hypothetical protein
MRKILVLLVFAVVVFVTGFAQAAPLTVTEGGLSLFLFDRDGSFSGDGFSVQFSAGDGVDTLQAFGTGIVSIAVGFINSVVEVEGSSCSGDPLGDPCGFITLTSPRLPPRPGDFFPPDDETYTAKTLFTATGQLFVGGGFDFAGQGTLTGIVCGLNSTGCPDSPILRYTFTVSEPPTLLLVVASFGTLGALFSARFLRDRWRRSCWTP